MSAKDECYALVQAIAVARDRLCRGPGCWERSTAGHHIFPGRGRNSTDFNPEYVMGLCAKCHDWAHRCRAEFDKWAIFLLQDKYREGEYLSNMVQKDIDFSVLKGELRSILAIYKKS